MNVSVPLRDCEKGDSTVLFKAGFDPLKESGHHFRNTNPRWLSGWSVRLPCGRSRVRIPAEADTETFANVGNLLTTSLSSGLSKDSGSIHLIHTIHNQEQHCNISLQAPIHVGTGSRSVPNKWHSFPPE